VAPPQTPLGELTALPPNPLARFGGWFAAGGLGWGRRGKGEGKGKEGEVEGGKGRAPSYC